MMKMAIGEGSPLRQGTGTGLDWFSVDTEACGGGTPDIGFFLEVWVYMRGNCIGNKSGGVSRLSTRRAVSRNLGARDENQNRALFF